MTGARLTMVSARSTREPADWRRAATAQADGGRIVHVAGTPEAAFRIAAAAAAIAEAGVFDQFVLDTDPESSVSEALAVLAPAARIRRVPAHGDTPSDAFEHQLRARHAVALLVYDEDGASLAAAIAAIRAGVAVVRVAAARGRGGADRVLTRLADLHLVASDADAAGLSGRVVPEQIRVIGPLVGDVVRPRARLARARAAWRSLELESQGYVLAILAGAPEPPGRQALRQLAARFPLVIDAGGGVWPAADRLPDAHAPAGLSIDDRLSLAWGAGAIVTDSRVGRDIAAAIGVRCYAFGAAAEPADGALVTALGPAELAHVRPAAHAPTPCAVPYGDGRAGARLATALSENFARLRLG